MSDREELLIRILCDTRPPGSAEAAYLFAQTADNQDAVFLAATKLLKHNLTRKILICGSGPVSGYPGAGPWRKALSERGIAPECIEEVHPHRIDMLHTLIEAESLTKYARTESIRTLLVVAAPFHQPRAFMTTVSVVTRDYPELRVYSYPGTSLPWDQQVVHSQGMVKAIRAQWIDSELGRIEKYQAKGDIISCTALLEYLNNRDR